MIKNFVMIGRLEAISFLLLVLIAVPLKYLADEPDPVAIIGLIHGILFSAYVFFLMLIWQMEKWPFRLVVLSFMAAIIPFGPFWLERSFRQRGLIK